MYLDTFLRSPLVAISATRCRSGAAGLGAPESPACHSLAFVRRGAYRIHRAGVETIIDPLIAQFFAAGEEYAISHPLECGDDCLDIGVPEEVLEEARRATWKLSSAKAPGVRSGTVQIPGGIQRDVCLLASRLESGLVSELEGEEDALTALRAVGELEYSRLARAGADAERRRPDRARRKVEAAKEALLADLGRNWSLSEVASLVGTSPFHLTRLVRRFTGAPLHRFLIRQRLAEALHRVVRGADDLTALALDLGFSSHSHFSAAFRREFGLPPSRARALARPH